MNLNKIYFVSLQITALCLFITMAYMSSVCYKGSRRLTRNYIPPTSRSCCLTNSKKPKPATTTEVPSYTSRVSLTNTSEQSRNFKWDQTRLMKKCQVQPNSLLGRFNITKYVTAAEVSNNQTNMKVKYGGVYRPSNCVSEQTVAIIIPYRDREEHLNILVNLLHNILQRQQLQYGIYVVEMALPVQFNRGLLANAGFLNAHSIGNYSCYIIHDVDLIPINDHNIYKCGSSPKHLSVTNTKFPHGLPYPEYVGGVIALSHEQYIKVNGFSNLFFGWGGEDDDLYKRMEASSMIIERPPVHTGTYLALPHKMDSSNPPNPYRDVLMSQSALRKDRDGITSVQFSRKALEFRTLYTWMLIDCTESEVIQNVGHGKLTQETFMQGKHLEKQPLFNMKRRVKVVERGKVEP